MERLTNANHKELGFCAYVGQKNPYSTPIIIGELSAPPNADYSPNAILVDVFEHLAAYEDTGLEPEEIMELYSTDKRAQMADLLRLEEYQELGSIDHLRELVQAEKNGRLVVLPCKVGDTVYISSNDGVHGVRVMGIRISASGKDTVLHLDTGSGTFRWGSDKGKTWFSTQKEAEAALKKRESDEERGHGIFQ